MIKGAPQTYSIKSKSAYVEQATPVRKVGSIIKTTANYSMGGNDSVTVGVYKTKPVLKNVIQDTRGQR